MQSMLYGLTALEKLCSNSYSEKPPPSVVLIIPERQRGFVVLPGTRFPPRVTHSVSDAERDRAREPKKRKIGMG